MAHIKYIFVHDHDRKNSVMSVDVALKPSGSVSVKCPVPPKFYAALIDMAQTAADAHEAQMRAEILVDGLTTEIEGGN